MDGVARRRQRADHRPSRRSRAPPRAAFRWMSVEFQAFWEAVIGVLLLVGAAVLVVTNNDKQIREIYMFAACWCWKACRSCPRSRSPSWKTRGSTAFSFWRNAGMRTAELIGLRPVAMPTVTSPLFPAGGLGNPSVKPIDRGALISWGHLHEEAVANSPCHRRIHRLHPAGLGVSRAIDPHPPAPYTARQVSA